MNVARPLLFSDVLLLDVQSSFFRKTRLFVVMRIETGHFGGDSPVWEGAQKLFLRHLIVWNHRLEFGQLCVKKATKKYLISKKCIKK